MNVPNSMQAAASPAWGIWESMQVAASPAWKFRNPCRRRRHPHGNVGMNAGGRVTRMGIWESMQAAASPAWEFGNPCRRQHHPHGNLEIHAGGGVTRMEKIESSGHKPADCTSERRNMPISKQIRVRRGYTKLSHHDFWLVLRRLYEGLLKNPHFPKPPVDLGLFKTKIDKYSAAITATMGGAKIAFSQRDSLREDLTKMLLELAGYVEAESYNDPAIFATSGLEALPSAHVPHQPLDR